MAPRLRGVDAMKMRVLVVALLAGCHDEGPAPPLITPVDMSIAAGAPPASGPSAEGAPADLAVADLAAPASAGDLGHAPPPPAPAGTILPGLDVIDVSVDQGGGVWGATASKVYYLPPGRSTPFGYDQKSGLARGWYTWTDTYYSPGTYPVTFSSVSGATAGQAMIGNIGAIADRLEVDPASGAVRRLDNLAVTMAQVGGTEYPEHLKRVVAVWRSVVDLNGTFKGTSYLGGFHGFYAFHGLEGDCGCLAFEEHQHYITDTTVYGDDVKGLAISPMGDVWTGDRDGATLLPQRSLGPTQDFFGPSFAAAIDVWPNVRDEINALAVDAAGGVWVGSEGNGLGYIAPATHALSYVQVPDNRVRGLAVDGKGALWVGTAAMGVGRFDPIARSWSWTRWANGLASDDVSAVYFDRWSGGGKIYVATDNGVSVITP
jgi:hypothetical protein